MFTLPSVERTDHMCTTHCTCTYKASLKAGGQTPDCHMYVGGCSLDTLWVRLDKWVVKFGEQINGEYLQFGPFHTFNLLDYMLCVMNAHAHWLRVYGRETKDACAWVHALFITVFIYFTTHSIQPDHTHEIGYGNYTGH